MDDKQVYEYIRTIIRDELVSQGLLSGQWHLGKVQQIISPTRLKVFVDGSDVAQTIPCDPDRTFNVNDEVLVLYINGNPRDKMVMCRRPI